jgi:hypothetical protein
MEDLLALRKIHGNVFLTRLPNGQDVPWRPLTIQEYLEYDKLLKLGGYPRAYIEDEIFCKCVLSKIFVENIEALKAGLVQAVVNDILVYSGPNDNINHMQAFLDMNRNVANQVMHQLVSVVCQAFPAYKPEDLYEMDYSTFMLRVAQAEDKLLRAGLLQEYISFSVPGAPEAPRVQQPAPEPPKPPKNAEEFKEQRKENIRAQRMQEQAAQVKDVAPPPPPSAEQTVIKKADIIEHQGAMTGHDQDVVNHVNAANETASIYTDYLEQLKSGGKIKIATPEERMEAAKIREKENKQKLLDLKNKTIEEMKVERKKLLEIREKERAKRKRRASRK